MVRPLVEPPARRTWVANRRRRSRHLGRGLAPKPRPLCGIEYTGRVLTSEEGSPTPSDAARRVCGGQPWPHQDAPLTTLSGSRLVATLWVACRAR